MKFKGLLHPLIISPSRVVQLFQVTHTPDGRWCRGQAAGPLCLAGDLAACSAGVWVGAGCDLSELRSLLASLALQFPDEKTELFRALSRQLGNLGSQQIRNVAVSSASLPSLTARSV